MQKTLKMLLVCALIVAMVGISTQCYAQDPAKKLGRGLANVVTGWVELPKNIYDTDPLLAAIFYGDKYTIEFEGTYL